MSKSRNNFVVPEEVLKPAWSRFFQAMGCNWRSTVLILFSAGRMLLQVPGSFKNSGV